MKILLIAACIAIAPATAGCKQSLTQIEQGIVQYTDLVVSDLEQGKGDTQIVDDILSQMGAGATIVEASNVFLNILNSLVSSHLLEQSHPELLQNAIAMANQTSDALVAKVTTVNALRIDKERNSK